MSGPRRVAAWITDNAAVVLVAALLLTSVFGAGLLRLEGDTSLEQFESDSPERRALTEASERFAAEEAENETNVYLAVRDDRTGTLSRESLLASLELQRAIRGDERIAPTLVDDSPTVGFGNVVATSLVHRDDIAALEERAAELERRERRLNETATELRGSLEEIRDLQRAYDDLNASYEAGEIGEERYRNRSADLEREIEAVVENATADLDANETAQFERAVGSVRSTQRRLSDLERDEFDSDAAYRRYRSRLEDDLSAAYTDGTVGVLSDEYDRLRADAERLSADRRALESSGQPPLDEQIAALESANASVYAETVDRLLAGEGPFGDLALEFLPVDYEAAPKSDSASENGTNASAPETPETRLIVVTQTLDPEDDETGLDALEERHVESQRAIAALADEHAAEADREYAVFGFGLFTDEIDRSLTDSLVIVGPLAVAFVVATLAVAYRDPLDIALGVVGILVVLIWTLGITGWAGIEVNQALVAVPVLLVGLSIDYAVHVVMRHREHRGPESTDARRGGDDSDGDGTGNETDVRGSMTLALAGVGVALTWATVTTAIGFLSNLVSPVAPIREFGLVSTVGILAAFAVFGAAVPAAKVELDERLERRGFDRRRRAFGTGRRLGGVLSIGARAARTAPVAVVVCAVLLTVAGAAGATGVDTALEQEDYLVEEPPDWTDRLPERIAPGEYRANQDLTYIDTHFQRETPRSQVIVEGDVTHPETIRRLATAQREAAGMETAATDSADEAPVESPLTVMQRVAAEDESFNASFQVADRDGDGVPDRNVERLYDRLFEVDSDAAEVVIARTDDGEYEAVRLLIDLRRGAADERVTEETRAVAAAIESGGGDGSEGGNENGTGGGTSAATRAAPSDEASDVSAIATGDPIVSHVLDRAVLTAMLESLAITLVVVAAVLAVAYRLTGAGAAFGVLTVLPVCLTVPWILGTMAVLDVSLNALTGTVASLTVGLGVAYCIHVSSRFRLELERGRAVDEALTATVRGTGGALLGSAATTIGGVATLLVAIVPVLRQFGAITGLLVAYGFLASVILLPSLLALWARVVDPTAAPEVEVAAETESETESGAGEPDDVNAEIRTDVDESDEASGSDRSDTPDEPAADGAARRH